MSEDGAQNPGREEREARLEQELKAAEGALSGEVRALLEQPPRDVDRVVALLDSVDEAFDPGRTEQLVQFLDADRPAAPAVVALGLHRRGRLAESLFPHRLALGVVAHTSPPHLCVEEADFPRLQFGCVTDHYRRVIRRLRVVKQMLRAIDDRAGVTTLDRSDAQLGSVLRARALTASLAYDLTLQPGMMAVFIEELVAVVMLEAAMLAGFLDVATGPILPPGRGRLASVVPEIIDRALRSSPRQDLPSGALIHPDLLAGNPCFSLGRWTNDAFAAAAREVGNYMQRLAA